MPCPGAKPIRRASSRRPARCGPALPDRPGAAGRRRGAHPPADRRAGLSLGIQDAFNLGWKLAAEVNRCHMPKWFGPAVS